MTPSESALDALAARAREALATPPVAPEPESEPAVGTAADGLVRAVVGPDGRVRSLTIDPKLFKRPLEDVTAAARSAINTALDAGSADPDYAPVVELIRDTQSQVRRDLGRVSTALAEVAQKVRERPRGGQF